mgnify:CR=1 FL=1
MNKYKAIYYVVAIALLVSMFLLIGIDLGWFRPYQSDQFIWAYFALIPKETWLVIFNVYCLGRFLRHACRDV